MGRFCYEERTIRTTRTVQFIASTFSNVELELSIDQLCMCNPLLTSTQLVAFHAGKRSVFYHGCQAYYACSNMQNHTQEEYITCYLGNPIDIIMRNILICCLGD